MSDDVFPYGNDLNDPDTWAGFNNTKSATWLIGYHSGVSLGLGQHTFLMFGRESLSAAVVTFTGIGITASYGMSDGAKKIERSGGQSTRFHGGGNGGGGGRVSETLKGVEDIKDRKDGLDQATAGDDLDSALAIYKVLHAQTNGMSALKPFSFYDLNYTLGMVSGAAVDVLIGGATAYHADAKELFKGANVFNISTSETLISAGLGSMMGYWRVKKFHSLWNELAHSSKEEYPFHALNVHPFFREWKSKEYSYQQRMDKIAEQDRIISGIRTDMINNPQKFGYPDSGYALQRTVEMQKILDQSGRDPSKNPFMPWVPFDQQHKFY